MGAIAVSKKEEQQIERLRKELRIPTKSGVLRAALKILERQTAEERLRQEVHESVNLSGAARQPINESMRNSLGLQWDARFRNRKCRSSVDICMWWISIQEYGPSPASSVQPWYYSPTW